MKKDFNDLFEKFKIITKKDGLKKASKKNINNKDFF